MQTKETIKLSNSDLKAQDLTKNEQLSNSKNIDKISSIIKNVFHSKSFLFYTIFLTALPLIFIIALTLWAVQGEDFVTSYDAYMGISYLFLYKALIVVPLMISLISAWILFSGKQISVRTIKNLKVYQKANMIYSIINCVLSAVFYIFMIVVLILIAIKVESMINSARNSTHYIYEGFSEKGLRLSAWYEIIQESELLSRYSKNLRDLDEIFEAPTLMNIFAFLLVASITIFGFILNIKCYNKSSKFLNIIANSYKTGEYNVIQKELPVSLMILWGVLTFILAAIFILIYPVFSILFIIKGLILLFQGVFFKKMHNSLIDTI